MNPNPARLSDIVRGAYAQAGTIAPYTEAQIRVASLFVAPIGAALDACRSEPVWTVTRAILAAWSGMICGGVPEAEATAVAELLSETFDVPPFSSHFLA